MLKNHEGFREEVRTFVRVFKDNPNLLLSELDLWGERNLSVHFEDGIPHLLMLDPHYRSESARCDEAKEIIKNRVDYLAERLNNVP